MVILMDATDLTFISRASSRADPSTSTSSRFIRLSSVSSPTQNACLISIFCILFNNRQPSLSRYHPFPFDVISFSFFKSSCLCVFVWPWVGQPRHEAESKVHSALTLTSVCLPCPPFCLIFLRLFANGISFSRPVLVPALGCFRGSAPLRCSPHHRYLLFLLPLLRVCSCSFPSYGFSRSIPSLWIPSTAATRGLETAVFRPISTRSIPLPTPTPTLRALIPTILYPLVISLRLLSPASLPRNPSKLA